MRTTRGLQWAVAGTQLRTRRQALGLTQVELARRLGVTGNTLARWERDELRPAHPDRLARGLLRLEQAPHDRTGATKRARLSARHNLPAEVSSFVGRQQELAELVRLLGTARLLTLTGAGGVGKTRLAREVARAVLESYRDGVWLVDLAALMDPALIPQTVATLFNLRETRGQPIASSLGRVLRTKHLLLIVDNCEHLLDACARLISGLLLACPELRVLATSRERLGITGEIAWRVPSLPVPDDGQWNPLEQLEQNPAVRLFAERAVAVQPQFALTEHNAPIVAQVCRRLDGIPLALELAAAHVEALTVSQLTARLDQRFRLLTRGSRAALPRQQTLRATLDWSYELLSEPERRLFNRIAVFAGGWTLEAAEAVCAGNGIDKQDVLELLARLVRKSIVILDEDHDDIGRYRLLETVRQYARERLESAGEGDGLRRRHATYFWGSRQNPPATCGSRLAGCRAPCSEVGRSVRSIASRTISVSVCAGGLNPTTLLMRSIRPRHSSRSGTTSAHSRRGAPASRSCLLCGV